MMFYFWQEEDVSDFVHKSANKNKKKGKKKQNETQAVHIVVSKDKVWYDAMVSIGNRFATLKSVHHCYKTR